MVEVQPGQLVASTAGRDQGAYYIVCRVVDERFVLVADGTRRPFERPKKKNLRHLWVYPVADDEVGRRLLHNGRVRDIDIQQALVKLMAAEQSETGEEVS